MGGHSSLLLHQVKKSERNFTASLSGQVQIEPPMNADQRR
jgi:hypothetical protein